MNKDEIKKITDYIFLESHPQKADIAMIFGTRHHEPMDAAYKLYKDGLVPKILLSGGINKVTGQNECEEMAKELIKMGVKKEDLILEDKSLNSLENVLFSKEKIEISFPSIKKIISIVKHYHSRRAMMTLKKHFPKNIELIPVCYDIYGFTKDNWFESEIGKEKVLEEWWKIPKYLAKGDIEEL